MKNEEYIDINKIAELKGLKSNRSLRLAIQKGKYIAREVKVFGGKSYEILYSSLEPEIQEKLQDELIKEATQSNCTALVPLNSTTKYPTFISESAKLTALARVDIVKALQNIRTKYKTKKEADSVFLDLYNSGMLLPKVYKFLGSISIGTLHRWIWAYEDNEDYRVLINHLKLYGRKVLPVTFYLQRLLQNLLNGSVLMMIIILNSELKIIITEK